MFIHQAFEVEEPAGEEELETDKDISQPEPEHEQSSENQHPETSITADEDSASLLPSSHPASEFVAVLEDDSNPHNPQDNIPDKQDISTSRLLKNMSVPLNLIVVFQEMYTASGNRTA